ncbi:MAG: biotin/lipoyl-binding protein [Anaerovibrio sp.]|jgi:HlyD family secretion protein|uniref:MFP transporter n=2 Tax=Anaerovibrio lipolyticus TaxID=82374 RepID=A0A0B2K0D3_9FIRM|nr:MULTISPECIES: biotin/lipoyl-binding protein [Anaerovibrio]KHM52276.1 MFP transporter [Anaerovibrio lipolyticus]MBO6244894.1 biotin/lipoyl-binding protein [Anaerovibrio sp.]SHI55363.1 HlyD family secretion protein [Anaerovibrio lipolyticus DSM 3074]
MDKKLRAKKFGMIFAVVMVVTGLLLMYTGNDALVLATEKKEGILTAEQIKLSFENVGGRMVKECVKEADQVKKGDVLMVLDSTDVDLSIAKLEAQIAQMKSQIKSAGGGVNIAMSQADTNEQQSFRQIDQQKAAVDAAEANYNNASLDYNRKVQLFEVGAISKADLDAAQTSLQVNTANVAQQKQLLSKLLAGTSDNGDTDSLNLPTIALERQTAANKLNDVEALNQQLKGLEVQLKELKVKKERLTLRAPEDGKIIKILAKEGEMIAQNTPVLLMESNRYYFDIYVSEEKVDKYKEGDEIEAISVAGKKKVKGTIRLLTQAPGFADLRMTREKGQADLTSFQMRIYLEPTEEILPGMTMGVKMR